MRDEPAPLGQSPAFIDVQNQISRIAPVDRAVLVIGERGTGKELAASRMHFLSKRWDGPFIKLNCAALSETLLDSELFGYEPGAFTGATKRRPGRFELADRGTLFLDEIGTASGAVQEKILRVIEYGEFERLGGTETLQVDVRVIAATNEDLPSRAAQGDFRDDLLDRLSFDVITLPPLRYRTGDVPLLAQFFGRAMAAELDWDGFPGFAKEAEQALNAYDWPGNIRELRNVVERAVAHVEETDTPLSELEFDPFASPYRPAPRMVKRDPEEPQSSSRPEPFADAARPLDFKAVVAQFETALLEKALDINRHSQKATASHLGLSYHQLRNALKKHGLLSG